MQESSTTTRAMHAVFGLLSPYHPEDLGLLDYPQAHALLGKLTEASHGAPDIARRVAEMRQGLADWAGAEERVLAGLDNLRAMLAKAGAA